MKSWAKRSDELARTTFAGQQILGGGEVVEEIVAPVATEVLLAPRDEGEPDQPELF